MLKSEIEARSFDNDANRFSMFQNVILILLWKNNPFWSVNSSFIKQFFNR